MNTLRSINWEKVVWGYLAMLGLVFFTTLVGVAIFALVSEAMSTLSFDRGNSGDLTGQMILDTDQITCGEDSHASITWVNETDSPIYITKAQVWMGMFKGSISDFAVWVQRVERPSTLMHSNWDHYADPVSPDHYIQMDYSPHHIAVKPGESISLNSFCSNMEDSGAVGHAVLTVWYYQ